MHFEALPNELVTHVFLSLTDISSAVALSSTCRYFRDIYDSSKRLFILSEAAEAEYGPVSDIVQLVTHNDSQPAHIRRSVPMSDALLHQIIKVGRTAQRWEEMYPYKKWKTDYANRRLLTSSERYTLRRALYRLWLYTKAFHNRHYIRTSRRLPHIIAERASLLQNFTTAALCEMLDVHAVLRDTVANNICPSNGKIRQKFHKRYPESNHQLLFNIHLNYPPAASPFSTDGWFHNSLIASSKYQSRLAPSRWHEPGAEGWGDDINHYYVSEDMMKLDPEQMLYLKDRMPLKSQVEAYVREIGGDWFVNNGETFAETLAHVVKQRGADLEMIKLAIEDYELGVVVLDD